MTTHEKIILVDPDDKQIGEIEKMRAHEFGMLHRAFSVIIFRSHDSQLQTLIQQRSKQKYHGGGLWTNTCCSHPHVGEEIKAAAENRLANEMGIHVSLTQVGVFHYIAKMDQGLTENEIDHVFVGTFDADTIPFNPAEVENVEWVEVTSLLHKLEKNPQDYTPWFKEALEIALKAYQCE